MSRPLPLLGLLALSAAVPLASPGPPVEAGQEGGAGASPRRATQRLEVEGLDGRVREHSLSSAPVTDPRKMGAYLMRPVFPTERDPVARSAPRNARIELASGDRLRGAVSGGAAEELHLELLGGVRLPLSIGRLRSVVFPERLPDELTAPLQAPREGDRLYQRRASNLDEIDGTVVGFSDAGVRFDSVELGPVDYPWSEVAALFVELLGDPPRGAGEGTPVVVDLADGSRLRGRLDSMSAAGVDLTVAGAALALDWEHVFEVAVADGRLVFLSELPAAGEVGKGTPFGDELGMVWPHRVDASVADGPLRSSGRVFTRGIGTHAPTRVTWRLDGGHRELRGLVGIDDGALRHAEGSRGSVVFRILLDGEPAWESGVVRGGDPPLAFPPVALGDARELTLEADPAGDFSGDRADWLRMVLVR